MYPRLATDWDFSWEPAYDGEWPKGRNPENKYKGVHKDHNGKPYIRVFKGSDHVNSYTVDEEEDHYELDDNGGSKRSFKYLSDMKSVFKKPDIALGKPIRKEGDPMIRLTDIEHCEQVSKWRKYVQEINLEQNSANGKFRNVRL